jgi:hypothetical protein
LLEFKIKMVPSGRSRMREMKEYLSRTFRIPGFIQATGLEGSIDRQLRELDYRGIQIKGQSRSARLQTARLCKPRWAG